MEKGERQIRAQITIQAQVQCVGIPTTSVRLSKRL